MSVPDPAESTTTQPGGVTPEELLELQLLSPLLAGHVKRAYADMPDGLRTLFDAGGLSNRHGGVLVSLLHTGSVTVGQLAGHLGLGLTNTSQLVADLDRAGCVERRTDPTNRRRTMVSLRNTVLPDVERFVGSRTAPLERAIQRLTTAQRRGFLAGLRAWAAEMEN